MLKGEGNQNIVCIQLVFNTVSPKKSKLFLQLGFEFFYKNLIILNESI